jgi:hypothetical protein
VSAAVVSAAAAVLWNESGGEGFEVMADLYANRSFDVNRNADFCGQASGGPCPPIHLVRVCDALGPTDTTACASLPDLSLTVDLDEWTDVQVVNVHFTDPDPWGVAAPPSPDCHGETLFSEAGVDASVPCPQWQLATADATPWIGTSPGANPCPTCGGGPGGSSAVLIRIDPTLIVGGAAPTLTDVTLVIGSDVADLNDDGNEASWSPDVDGEVSSPPNVGSRAYRLSVLDPETLTLEPLELPPGGAAVVCLPTQYQARGNESMVLTMKIVDPSGDERSVVAPVLNLPPGFGDAAAMAADGSSLAQELCGD